MDVVGTASAVLGILQVGFSLAKAIRETVKDYKDAADDLISLAQEIESTLYLVSQLDRLVVDNKKTGTFNDGGLAELNRCLKNTEQIVEALVELLTKTGISHPPGTKVKPEDLIISRPHRRKWLGQKSRVKDKQDELNKVRLEVTTIILLRDTLQADPSANKAMQQALITAERDRRRKARARRKKQNGNGQVRQPRPNAHKITTGRSPTRMNIPPPPSIISRSGRRGFESFAYRAEGSSSGPNKEIATKRAMSRSDRANGSPDSNKVMIEKDLAEEDANATTASENVANGKKRTGNPVDENTTSGNTAYANVADLGSDVAVDSAVPRLASGNSPAIQHSVHQRQPQLSREAIIEEFKRQVKADGIKLSEAYQAMMERATKSLEHDESDHGLRKFLEAEYAQEWAGMFGEWLPGTRPELVTSPNTRKVEKPSKLQRWSFTKSEGKQSSPSTSNPPSPDIPRSAHLLVITKHGDRPNILRLNPPKRLERPDIRRTGLIWTSFGDDIRDAIWETLRLAFTPPDGFQWVLHSASMLDPGPSLLTRGLTRLVPHLGYKKVDNDSYIVVFVSANSKQYRTGGFGQVDIADYDMPAGLPVPADTIPGPYSLQDRRREHQPETAIPPRERRYTPAHTFQQDAIYSRRYTGSPAFAPLGHGPPADRIHRDRMPVDRIPVNRMPADRMPVDRMHDRMQIDPMQDVRMPFDQMPSYPFSRRRYSPSPPGFQERRYPQRTPRPRDGDSPGRNGHPPLSEDKDASAPRARMSARLPGEFSNYNRRRRPDRSSSESTESFWSAPADSSDEFGGRRFAYSSPRDHREHLAHRRPNSLRSDDVESGDQSDDSLDDDELYDQLLRKFTGHGMRERETADGDSDGDVNGGTDEDVDGNADQDVTGDEGNHVEAGGADKIIGGDADDTAAGRDDKSDKENSPR